jgi:hypothetical protein
MEVDGGSVGFKDGNSEGFEDGESDLRVGSLVSPHGCWLVTSEGNRDASGDSVAIGPLFGDKLGAPGDSVEVVRLDEPKLG